VFRFEPRPLYTLRYPLSSELSSRRPYSFEDANKKNLSSFLPIAFSAHFTVMLYKSSLDNITPKLLHINGFSIISQKLQNYPWRRGFYYYVVLFYSHIMLFNLNYEGEDLLASMLVWRKVLYKYFPKTNS